MGEKIGEKIKLDILQAGVGVNMTSLSYLGLVVVMLV